MCEVFLFPEVNFRRQQLGAPLDGVEDAVDIVRVHFTLSFFLGTSWVLSGIRKPPDYSDGLSLSSFGSKPMPLLQLMQGSKSIRPIFISGIPSGKALHFHSVVCFSGDKKFLHI